MKHFLKIGSMTFLIVIIFAISFFLGENIKVPYPFILLFDSDAKINDALKLTYSSNAFERITGYYGVVNIYNNDLESLEKKYYTEKNVSVKVVIFDLIINNKSDSNCIIASQILKKESNKILKEKLDNRFERKCKKYRKKNNEFLNLTDRL